MVCIKILNLQIDNDVVHFIDSYEFRRNEEYWWPGDSSPYKEVNHFLPNHYLNLETGLVKRYWPTGDLYELSLNEAKEQISVTLKSLLRSALNRFDLTLSITECWDSRVILAACKEISHKIY